MRIFPISILKCLIYHFILQVNPLPPQTQSHEEIRGIREPREEVDQMSSESNTTPATTTGQCKAVLPDGRLQTVVYTCAPTGYSAVVQYHKPENHGVNHEANETANTSIPSTDSSGGLQHLQPITEIIFRPTGESTRTTVMPEKPEIPSTSTIPPRLEVPTKGRRKLEPITAITPPHRLHGAPDKIALVQLQHSLPFLSAVRTPSAAIPTGRDRNSRVSTETSIAEPSSTTAATIRGRTRWNASLRGQKIQSELPS